MAEPVDYSAFINLISAYEKKYSRSMKWNELINYIAAVRKIQLSRARVYARDLCYMQKIYLDENQDIKIKAIKKGGSC